jgi:hypothetical protein
VVNKFLKFPCRSTAIVEREIRLTSQINWAQEYGESRGLPEFDGARSL